MLRADGLYTRADDPLASTEFTYSRFLTPALAGFSGPALYCDSDFLWLDDIADLAASFDTSKAVQCVEHNYRPVETQKMDGKVQAVYPRKNWSSLMLFNCDHSSVRALTPQVVNGESAAFLHRMQWVADRDIGQLDPEWNWLEGWDQIAPGCFPKAIHFTRGGPWFQDWKSVAFADLWLSERRALERDVQKLESI
jgi:hypothetical protein